MKKQKKGFECYPLWMVLLYNIAAWSIPAAGLYLLYIIHPVLSVLLLIDVIYLESSIYREGCANCYYYGKRCVSGRGLFVKLLLKKGDPKKFTEKDVSFKDMLPSMVPSVATIIAGIYLLITSFSWLILVLTVWPVIVWFFGNPIVYGELACPNCKQAILGCPVCEMFKKQALEAEKKKKAEKKR